MKKITLFSIVCFALCTALLNCGKDNKASQNTLAMGIMPDVDSVPYIIAQRNGYYKAENLNVKIENFKSAKDRDSALQSGSLDGIVTDLLAVIFANEGGIKLLVPAKTDGDIKLVASKNSGIKKLGDVKGKKLGLSTNTIMEYTLDKLLESAGINPEEVLKVAIPQIPTRLEMLNNEKIDAAILPDPMSLLAIKDGGYELSSIGAIKENISIGVVAFTDSVIKNKPDQMNAFLRAYNKAVDYLNAEPPANYMDFVIKTQGFPAKTKDVMKLPKYAKIKLPSEKSFYSAVKWLKDKNLIKENYEYTEIVTDIFIR